MDHQLVLNIYHICINLIHIMEHQLVIDMIYILYCVGLYCLITIANDWNDNKWYNWINFPFIIQLKHLIIINIRWACTTCFIICIPWKGTLHPNMSCFESVPFFYQRFFTVLLIYCLRVQPAEATVCEWLIHHND